MKRLTVLVLGAAPLSAGRAEAQRTNRYPKIKGLSHQVYLIEAQFARALARLGPR